jgi:taurine transport system substrate-binding protein
MRKIQVILLVLILGVLSGCGKNENVVNLGLLMVPNDAILAKEMGLFEQKFGLLGYEVSYTTFDSGSSANTAIVTGDIDFATMGNINGLIALGQNLDAELIWIHETLGAIEGLAVKSDLGFTSPEDLANLDTPIATPFASTAHYVLLNVLKEAGIEDQVELVNMKTSEIVAAWENGSIDAAYTWQPTLGMLLNSEGEILIDSEDMIAKGYMTANIELVRKSFSEEHPELVKTYIECMQEAYLFYKTNEADAVNLLANALELTENEVREQVSGSIWTSIDDMSDDTFITNYVNTMYEQTIFCKEQSLLDRVVTKEEVTAFINHSYATDVKNENYSKDQ